MNYHKENLKPSIILSTFIHVGMMFALYFGLPSFFVPPPAMPWKPIPIDIVDIGAITNTRIKKQKPTTAKTSPKKKKMAAKKPKPKPAVKKKPVPLKKAEAIAIPKKKKIKKHKPKKKIKKKKQEPAEDPLASVLKNIEKMKPVAPTIEDVKEDVKKQLGKESDNKINQQGLALSNRLTISEEDALRRQISSCWNMPIGARDAENLIVEVLIEVRQDRTVSTAKIIDQMRMSTDPYFRAAAEAALRALRHPRCSPLDLPPDQYEQWKTIRFTFDPRDML